MTTASTPATQSPQYIALNQVVGNNPVNLLVNNSNVIRLGNNNNEAYSQMQQWLAREVIIRSTAAGGYFNNIH